MDNEELFLKGNELYEQGHFAEAFAVFLCAAKNGDASCMTWVASMYTCGEGTNCDYDKAIKWELEALNGGETSAMVNLGISYRIKGDIKEAKYWFKKSLEAGDGSGALELAKLYMVSEKEIIITKELLKLAIASEPMCEADIEEAKRLLSEL